PIHLLAPALAELTAEQWDEGNECYPATTFQVSNLHGGTGATNVLRGTAVLGFSFRLPTASTPDALEARLPTILGRHELDYDLDWTRGGEPFLTAKGELSTAMAQAILDETGVATQLSTTGGTSDGRFIAKICQQVIEFG